MSLLATATRRLLAPLRKPSSGLFIKSLATAVEKEKEEQIASAITLKAQTLAELLLTCGLGAAELGAYDGAGEGGSLVSGERYKPKITFNPSTLNDKTITFSFENVHFH